MLRWGGWSTPRPGRCTPGTGGWVGPMAAVDGCGKSRPYRHSIPGLSSKYQVAIPAHSIVSFKVHTRLTKQDNRQLVIHNSAQVYIGISRSTAGLPLHLNSYRPWSSYVQVYSK